MYRDTGTVGIHLDGGSGVVAVVFASDGSNAVPGAGALDC